MVVEKLISFTLTLNYFPVFNSSELQANTQTEGPVKDKGGTLRFCLFVCSFVYLIQYSIPIANPGPPK